MQSARALPAALTRPAASGFYHRCFSASLRALE